MNSNLFFFLSPPYISQSGCKEEMAAGLGSIDVSAQTHTHRERECMLTTWPSSCWCVSSTFEMCNYGHKKKEEFLLLFTWARLLSTAPNETEDEMFFCFFLMIAPSHRHFVFVFRCYVSPSLRNVFFFCSSWYSVVFLKINVRQWILLFDFSSLDSSDRPAPS